MKTIQYQTQIPDHLAGLRLDQALAQLYPEFSRSRLQTWIKTGKVSLDGKPCRASEKVTAHQQIKIDAELEEEVPWQPQDMDLNIIYEDNALIIVNKPAGLVVHPGAGNRENTLVNALLNHAPELAAIPRAGIVHRLDKNTSGLLVVARTLEAHQSLIQQMQARKIKREYEAIVNGVLISGGTINAPIGRDPIHRTHMAVREDGKESITHYRIIERFPAYTHLKIQLETGRTHQIRVHMAHIRHFVVGDPVYGGRFKLPQKISVSLKTALQNFKRQALHASSLQLQHPQTKEKMQWDAPLPEDMQALLLLLRENKLK